MNKKILQITILSTILSVFLSYTLVRLIAFKDDRIHTHANMAVFVDGKKLVMTDPTFYEETAACSAEDGGPKSRVHLHDQKPESVHIHDKGATWGHLLANIGYSMGKDMIQTDEGIFLNGKDGKNLTFLLNGKKVSSVYNDTIQSEDVLLINFGSDPEAEIQKRYDAVSRDAAKNNASVDPITCQGSKPLSLKNKLLDIYGIKRAY